MNLYLETKTSKDRPYSNHQFSPRKEVYPLGELPFSWHRRQGVPPAESHPFLNCCALYNLGRSEIVRLERLVFCSMCF